MTLVVPVSPRREFGRLVKHAKEQTGEIPGLLPGVKLFPHQKLAIEKLVKQDGNLLLSHPVGSGKTITSIAAFEELRNQGKAANALVVVPASLRNNFLDNGVKKFTSSNGVIFGTSQEVNAGTHVSLDKPSADARYHIVSYEMYRKDPKRYIEAAGADTVIYDELHKAKNEGVKTTEAIRDARKYHRNFIGMTGSIVSNTPADLVPLVDAMTNGKHVLGTKTTFESRFVEMDDKGQRKLKNPQVVRTLLNPYIHHVDPSELGNRAPKKEIDEVRVEMSPHQSKLYRYVTDQLDPVSKMALKAGVSKLNNAELNNIFSKLIRLRQVSNAVHTMDQGVTLSDSAMQTPKIKKILDDVEEHIREVPDAQVVLHTNLIQGGVDVLTAGLKTRNIDHALFIGKGQPGVTEKSRQQGVKEYQQGAKKVIVLSAAGGEGLDLPNTTFMGMVDGHFNPERINQAEARGIRSGGLSHRPEDKRQVMVRRYVSVLPSNDLARVSEVAKGIWDLFNPVALQQRINAGAPAFYNPFKKELTTDQWVYDIAAKKRGLNTALHDTIKTGSAHHILTTHEDFEDFIKAAALPAPLVQALMGAAAGGVIGALQGGTDPRTKREREQDPNAALRNRISSTLGGAVGGAFIGATTKDLLSMGPIAPILGTIAGASAGRSIGNLMAPVTKVPKSVLKVIGEGKLEYSDKEIFKRYWDQFGRELEDKGHDATLDPEKEKEYVDALRTLYTEAAASKDDLASRRNERFGGKKGAPPTKSKFYANAATALAYPSIAYGTFGAALSSIQPGTKPADAFRAGLITGLPMAAAMAGSLAGDYRKIFIDPGLSVKSKSEARIRRDFDDEKLKKLLRGMSVDEVKIKSHVLG